MITNRSAEDAVIRTLMERAPNWVNYRTLRSALNNIPDQLLTEAINRLVGSRRVEREEDSRQGLADIVQYYKLVSYDGIPIKNTIMVGKVDVHRLLVSGNPMFFPEEFNEAIENLSKHADGLEERFQILVRREQQKYWANVVSIFGVFISVLALVLISLPKITTDPTLPFWKVVELNLGQLLPLAVVLAIFVIVLRAVIR